MNTVWHLLKHASSNLVRNKTRSFLTMLGMIIGVASVILLVAIGAGLKNLITKQFESIGSNNLYIVPGNVDLAEGPASRFTNQTSALKFEYLDSLSHLGPPIGLVTGFTENFTSIKRGPYSDTVGIYGADTNTLPALKMTLASGQNFSPHMIRNGKKVAIIGQTVIDHLFNGTDPLGQQLSIGNGTNVTVIGTYAEKGGGLGGASDLDNLILIPYPLAGQVFDKTAYDSILLAVDSTDNIPAAKTKTTHALLKLHLKPDEFTIIEPAEILSTIDTILNAITLALGGIAAISLVVGGIGIMNIMLVSVTERIREIGLRKAVGATASDILWLFLTESILISLLGGTLGILLATTLTLAINRFVQTHITPWSILLAFGFSVFVGIIFGVAPAIKAAKLDPIKALRYE